MHSVNIGTLTSDQKRAFAREQNTLLQEMGFAPKDACSIIGACGPGLAVEVADWTLQHIVGDGFKSAVQTVFSGLDPEYSRKRTLATLEHLGYTVPKRIGSSRERLDQFVAGVRAVSTARSVDNALQAAAFNARQRIEATLLAETEAQARRAA